jgi:hypothetical protein
MAIRAAVGREAAENFTPATTSERPVKTSLRDPKIDPGRRTTIILTVVAVLLCMAVTVEVAARYL